jgi:hypothetical protein
MRAKFLPFVASLLIAAAANAAVPAQSPLKQAAGEPTCPGDGGLVKADVVALDQVIVLNRLGAGLPNGMIFALAEDVCLKVDGQSTCGVGPPSAGHVMLRPEKRPRPLVLRVNQGQCLEITFTNLLGTSPVAITTPAGSAETQPTTRAAGIHVQGMEWVKDAQDDGSWVGTNKSSLVNPGDPSHVYTLYAAHEGSFLLYSTGDVYTSPNGAGGGDGGQLAYGLFGAVHVEPKGAEWYRSQVTAEDLKLATKGYTPAGQPILDYHAVYPAGLKTARAGVPILNLLTCPNQARDGCPLGGRIVHSDLTALIAGRGKDGQPGLFPESSANAPVFNPAYALPDRQQPYREFTIIYHELFNAVQAFDQMYAAGLNFDGNGADNYAFNYGSGGIASEILANRLGVGPMGNCPSCKYEEFFLTSWAVGDPAMVVNRPATDACTPIGLCDNLKTACDPDDSPSTCPAVLTAKQHLPQANGKCLFTGKYSCDTKDPEKKATVAYYPDDPSNVYHSYISDHTKFRILHAGADLHHVHHQHAHQWFHSPDTPNGYYTDSQTFGPGSAFTLEMVYNGSGNVNQTVGDAIFHCHFYPHFAGGMWSLWRVHDVLETGTPVRADGRVEKGARALPDGEIADGTPIPAVVPLPSLPMALPPAVVHLTAGGTEYQVCDKKGANCVSPFATAKLDPKRYANPGYPFFIPGIGGQRAPHPPLDFAHENPDDPTSAALDGGLPRHLIRGCPVDGGCATAPPLNAVDFSKTLKSVQAFKLPEVGTGVEQLAMAAHGVRFHPTYTQALKPLPAQFTLNGLPAVPGAPYADPCINFSPAGGKPTGLVTRRYKAADIQLDAVFNKEGWHFPQERMLALWGDVQATLAGKRASEPLFFRANSGECIEYTLANLVPNVYELDDFQVRTPTDILGQHIHLVKFDVTSSDGATNGFNYEDGTFSPDEVTERIRAINAGGGLRPDADPGAKGTPLTAKALQFFGPGPGGRWMGAQATIQRWYADPLFDGPKHNPPALLAVDRTLRTVFTHDHFGPSTHQQAGLYAGLVIEPKGSRWFDNESLAAAPFGGVDPGTGQPIPGRTVTGANGQKLSDGGPTTWQAVIETPESRASFREFVFAVQDSTLTYLPFDSALVVNKYADKGWCSVGGGSCMPATLSEPASGCDSGVCYAYGFCSSNLEAKCKLATWQTDEDISACGNKHATCNLVPGIPGQIVASFNTTGTKIEKDIALWSTLPIDAPNKVAAEVITNGGATNSFSMNYRNEPLYPRITDPKTQKPSVVGTLGDLAYAYTSQPRPWLVAPTTAPPYPPLTQGLNPGDPFTPLLRSYAGDDVQVRTLVTGQINPHNLAIHGVHWLSQPGWVDSGWRGSQVMGISEHFEQIFRLPSWVSTPTVGTGKQADYLFMAGAAAIEQAGGNWSLLRAYGNRRDDLRPLPQNQNPASAAALPVCPAKPVPPHQNRAYTVVALPGSVTYTALNGGISDPNAILYFKVDDLKSKDGSDCPHPPIGSCVPKRPKAIEPLVLRANAGDCVTVTLYNFLTAASLPGGASAPNLPPPTQADPPTFGLTCASGGTTTACLTSNTSPSVGLHPQLPTFDASTSDGFNVGTNPVQTVTIGNHVTYTWYAGNVDVRNPINPYIPIELGVSNLLPADIVNHYQHGLFGALVIEPEGATGWQESDSVEARVQPRNGPAFHEFVLATQDGLANPPTATSPAVVGLGAAGLTAANFKTMQPNFSGIACPKLSTGDVSCLFSDTAQCCSTALNTSGACPTGSSVDCNKGQVPILTACAGEPVRFRLIHPGGLNTNQVFELFGHVWTETPYESEGLGCAPQTTHTNLYASSIVSNQRGCTPAKLAAIRPRTDLLAAVSTVTAFLPSYRNDNRSDGTKDSLSIWQGSRSGHGPGNHFDILIERAGGSNAATGDYLFRTYPADQLDNGLWGIFRVQSCARVEVEPAVPAAPAKGGGGR